MVKFQINFCDVYFLVFKSRFIMRLQVKFSNRQKNTEAAKITTSV